MKKEFYVVAVVLGIFLITSSVAFASCPVVEVFCIKINTEGKVAINHSTIAGHYPVGQCWSWWPLGCYPCAGGGELASKCESDHPNACRLQGCVACVHEAGHYQMSTGTACFNIKGEDVPVSEGDL